uniref:Bidirectional sugar transporter SWEET n=1 Tax=Oryza nivara TaxID=4536 RepID=A0A0E0FWL0_ORYNI
MEHIARFFFGVSGNVIALFLFLSPVVTFWRIIKKRSTEDFSGVPYNMTLLNCLLSAWYGLPFVSPNNILVTTINGTGSVIEAIYVVIFLIFAERKARLKMMGLLGLVTSIFTMVVLVSLLALHGQGRKLFCGLAATIFSICMYASPLSIMRLVIKTKSVEFMPFLLSLSVFLCGTSWFIYGLLGRDPFIAIPNGCGSFLGLMQLILYAIYRNHKGATPAAAAGKGDAADEVEDAKKAAAAVEMADAKTNKVVADDADADADADGKSADDKVASQAPIMKKNPSRNA